MNTTDKKILIPIALLAAVSSLFTGCKEDEPFTDVTVTEVKQFYEPADSKYVVLNSSGSMYFEWEPAHATDNSIVYYDVLFDTEDGDFSNPVYVQPADNGGVSTGATVTHKTINKIAGLAGIDFAAEGKIKWTVRSSRGLNFVIAPETRTLTVLRINSVEELTGPLYITGAGAEDGQQFKPIGATQYEIYTRLEAGLPYYFYSMNGDTERMFVVDAENGSFRETSTTPEVSIDETGVYRITLDFEAASAKLEQISKLELVVSWTQRRTEIPYVAKGVWKVENYNIQLAAAPWGFDERYKFVFTIDGAEEHWGQFGPHFDNRPPIDRVGYRDMAPTEGGQWGGSQFKFPNELTDGENLERYSADVTVYMSTDKPNYTHDFTNITG